MPKIKYIFFLIVIALSFILCSKEDISLEQRAPELSLDYQFYLTSKEDQVNFNLGIWMFNNKTQSRDAIANWINVQHLGKTVLEPINVLWIDLKAQNETEATKNIVNFLTLNNFKMRSGSSIGYYSFFENFEWVRQYQETWSDNLDPNTINNHGRIFLAHKITSEQNNTVFVSSGAFSIESKKHLFISFKDALKQFNAVDEWSLYIENLNIGNTVNLAKFSTFDHEGIKVFVLN